jgi:hypothetical protein
MASYLSQVAAGATQAEEFWYIHRSDCRHTLIYVHTNSRILPIFHKIIGSLITAPEDWDFFFYLSGYILFKRRVELQYGER